MFFTAEKANRRGMMDGIRSPSDKGYRAGKGGGIRQLEGCCESEEYRRSNDAT